MEFFLERYIKKLKGLVRQMDNIEGSMGEGYISYESFYYASEYIKQIENTPGVVIWDDEWMKTKEKVSFSKRMEKGA